MHDHMLDMHFWDGVRPLKSMLGSITLVFDVILNAPDLEKSLKKLIEMDGWNRLGAGLRAKVSILQFMRLPLLSFPLYHSR
jgi:hypothetical protein